MRNRLPRPGDGKHYARHLFRHHHRLLSFYHLVSNAVGGGSPPSREAARASPTQTNSVGTAVLLQLGCPVDDQSDGLEGTVTDGVHQEALTVRRDVVVGSAKRHPGRIKEAHAPRQPGIPNPTGPPQRPSLGRRSQEERARAHPLSIAAEPRLQPRSAICDRFGKRADIDLGSTGLIRVVGKPATVGRDRRKGLLELAGQQIHWLTTIHQIEDPKIRIGLASSHASRQ